MMKRKRNEKYLLIYLYVSLVGRARALHQNLFCVGGGDAPRPSMAEEGAPPSPGRQGGGPSAAERGRGGPRASRSGRRRFLRTQTEEEAVPAPQVEKEAVPVPQAEQAVVDHGAEVAREHAREREHGRLRAPQRPRE
jgi:hypothetical protein